MTFRIPKEKRQELINIIAEVKADMDSKMQMGIRFDGMENSFYNNAEKVISVLQTSEYYDNREISIYVTFAYTLWDTPYFSKADELTKIFLNLSQYIVSDRKETS